MYEERSEVRTEQSRQSRADRAEQTEQSSADRDRAASRLNGQTEDKTG